MLLVSCVSFVLAPPPTTRILMQTSPWTVVMERGEDIPKDWSFAKAAAATAGAAVVAASAIMAVNTNGLGPRYEAPGSSVKHSKNYSERGASPIKVGVHGYDDACTSSSDAESEPEDFNNSGDESNGDDEGPVQKKRSSEPEDFNNGGDESNDDDEGPVQKKRSKPHVHLWTRAHFPEGTNGASNWDMENLKAAQQWECPCKDRWSCIGGDGRLGLFDLYEYRKQFRTTASSLHGGFRDGSRKDLEAHYDRQSGLFTRSFVVGPFGDCCAASAGLAKGISFATFANSRADVTKQREWHAGRCKLKAQVQSQERAHLEAYIRELRSELEGPKGGSRPKDKWSLPKQTAPQRWEDYKRKRKLNSAPIIGSQSLFEKIWREHDDITEYGAKGHAKCDVCGTLQVDRLRYEGRPDKLREVEEMHVRHKADHLGERDYAEDIWLKAEHQPTRVTALSMDAPTETQFDIPVQQRTSYDPVKCLDTAKKWSSKITGLMIAGVGMLAFVSRDGLGSGANLSCTVLYLGLLRVVAVTGGIGQVLNVLLDNTGADNKNNEMIFFLAWLVMQDVTEEASFFCMMKGHTYSRIDQTFRTLIMKLLAVPVWTVNLLMHYIRKFLGAYGCSEVIELHCLWDWKAFFAPHVHERFTGFGTGQFGSGMHEFVLRKDRFGEVCFWHRKSSQAIWLPEGNGMPVFKTRPTGIPSLASAKADHQWGRPVVESTIRAWYRFLSVNATDDMKVRQEWEARFAALPPDGDTEQLPPGQKLVWHQLPKFTPARGAPVLPNAFVTDHMQNPPVNPVTGFGRTAADVQHELTAYRQRLRSTATADNPPVFQADFLFVQPPGGDVSLHRVVNGIWITDATDPNISFTTVEYLHHPQQDHPGFWGHFDVKENPHYDRRNKKAGALSMRHQNIARDHILLYDVQTFLMRAPEGSGSMLYVSAASLMALAAKTPVQPPVPAQLPTTHLDIPLGGHGGRGSRRGGRGGGRGGGRSGGRGGGRSGVRGEDRGGGRGGRGRGRRGLHGDAGGGRSGLAGEDEVEVEEDEVEEDEVEEDKGSERSEQEGSEGSDRSEVHREGYPEGEEGQEGDSDNEDAEEVLPIRPAFSQSRDGAEMEMQACDLDECDFVCSACLWKPCTVKMDHGAFCDVWLRCDRVANRFLRPRGGAAAGSSNLPSNWAGMEMEVKGCDPDVCTADCDCPWEPCIIDDSSLMALGNDGTSCSIKVLCENVPNRILRMPSAAKRRRQS